ncbi:MAG: 1,2-phenylacetyl-CoA epoxidase subunit B [Phycisphaerae bacterium]
MSKIRQEFQAGAGELATPPETDSQPYEVFIQLTRGQPHSHAGTVDAVDGQMAMEYARKHYGRDQECVHMWVVPREAIISVGYDKDIIWPVTDQGYRLARGYAADVRRKWEHFRSQEDVDAYQREDIKEAF